MFGKHRLRPPEKAKMKLAIQSERAECGLACIAMVTSIYTPNITLRWLRRRYPPSLRGTSIAQLKLISEDIGVNSRLYAAKPEALSVINDPCIIFVDHSHFVVMNGRTHDGRYRILDPAIGPVVHDESELRARFSGLLLRIISGARFAEVTAPKDTHWRTVLEMMARRASQHSLILVATLLIEVLTFTSPLYVKVVFDQIYRNGNQIDLTLLLLIFIALVIARSATGLVKGAKLARFGVEVIKELSELMLSKILSLPPEYFTRRYPAEIISRLGSLHELQELMTTKIVSVFIDAAAIMTLIGICATYSAKIGATMLTGALAFLTLRVLFGRRIQDASNLLVARLARQDGEVIETIRSAQSIKANGAEEPRLRRFMEKQSLTLASSVEVQQLAIRSGFASDLIFNAIRLLVIYWGAKQVISGALSAGSLVAISLYVEMLCQRASSIAPKLLDLKISKVHLRRIDDITQETSEGEQDFRIQRIEEARIRCIDLGFRYSQQDQWILRGLDLDIKPGETIAISGESGRGKTTLLKIISGVLTPDEGSIEINEVSINPSMQKSYRRNIGYVMQNDTLLSGTILENITFDDKHPDTTLVWKCLKLARIDEFVRNQPMQLHTHTGDGGGLLSGGQQQRILIARALYRKPYILVLDEATSQLDYQTEKEINHALSGLTMTKIISTHRATTLPPGTRIIQLNPPSERHPS